MPTFETPEGNVIRDGAAIIEHFEAIAGHPFSPSTPKQRILSLLFDVIGAEGLLRPAMHYRWNFSKENLDFLRFHFQSVMPAGPDRAAKADAAAALCINQWIDAQEGLAPGTPLLRGVGLGSFEVRGITINALAQPYRFFLLKRMQSAYASLPKPDQQKVANMLRSCDMQELLEIALSRDIGRENNLEIWL